MSTRIVPLIVSLAQGELVHSEHPWCVHLRIRQAAITRRSVDLLARTASVSAKRAPARPASITATCCSTVCSPALRLPCRQSAPRPARRTWPAGRRGRGSGTAGPVTRSPRDARRPRCRRGGVRIGCALGPTSSSKQDTQPAPPTRGLARSPTRRRPLHFRAQRLRPGGTTGPGGTHHPRPFVIAVVVTLRGSGTESDPEPRFTERRQVRTLAGPVNVNAAPKLGKEPPPQPDETSAKSASGQQESCHSRS